MKSAQEWMDWETRRSYNAIVLGMESGWLRFIRNIQADALREATKVAFEHSRRGDFDDGKGNRRITIGKGFLVMELERKIEKLESSS